MITTALKNKTIDWSEYLRLRENAAAKAKSYDMYYVMALEKRHGDNNIYITTMYGPIFQNCSYTASMFLEMLSKIDDSYILVVDNKIVACDKPENIITDSNIHIHLI